MAISLKNVDDRLKIVESYNPIKVQEIITDSNHLKLTATKTQTLTNTHFKTAKWAFVDWTLDDKCRSNTYQSVVLPLSLMRLGKMFCVSDCYGSAVYQGIRITLDIDKLHFDVMLHGIDSDDAVWIRYLAVFKYYLNTVLGWVM